MEIFHRRLNVAFLDEDFNGFVDNEAQVLVYAVSCNQSHKDVRKEDYHKKYD